MHTANTLTSIKFQVWLLFQRVIELISEKSEKTANVTAAAAAAKPAVEVCTGTGFQSHAARSRTLYVHPHPLPYTLWSSPTRPCTSFFPSTRIPVDVALVTGLYAAAWNFTGNMYCSWPASERRFAARPEYGDPAINYTFCSHIRNFTGPFTWYSNACTWSFIVCKIS